MIDLFHSLKIKELINELGKVFPIEENGFNPVRTLPILQNNRPKDPKIIYF